MVYKPFIPPVESSHNLAFPLVFGRAVAQCVFLPRFFTLLQENWRQRWWKPKPDPFWAGLTWNNALQTEFPLMRIDSTQFVGD